jgi:hypothetical protein
MPSRKLRDPAAAGGGSDGDGDMWELSVTEQRYRAVLERYGQVPVAEIA